MGGFDTKAIWHSLTNGRRRIMRFVRSAHIMRLVRYVRRAAILSAVMGTLGAPGTAIIAQADNMATDSKTGDLVIPFDANSARYWRFVSDRVMGGISDGDLAFADEDGIYYARMTGDVSTANNGGFIQFRAGLSLAGMADQNFTGVRLMVRGNGAAYYVHFRTTDSRRPQDYYAHSFATSAQWQMVELPFADFENSQWYRDEALAPENIRSMGIVAYGRDHQADIAVAAIEFYE